MSDAADYAELERRIRRLEGLIAELVPQESLPPEPDSSRAPDPSPEPTGSSPVHAEEAVEPPMAVPAAPPEEPPPPEEPAPCAEPVAARTDAPDELAGHGERWLARVGVAFVVLAFGFLFKYAFDQGWVTPAFRLMLGLIAGTVMMGVGLRLEGSRERYSQYLLGGGVGVFYLVGFAAFQLYELVAFAPAFAFMVAVTVLAFFLAERQRYASLAVMGALGGLATPFLLHTEQPDVPGLVAYTALLLVGSGAVQLRRGWRLLLFVLGFGGLLVLLIAADAASEAERTIVLMGLLVAWIVFSISPLVRAHMRARDPERWDVPSAGWVTGGSESAEDAWEAGLLRLACYLGALLTVLEIAFLFDLSLEASGRVVAVGAVAYVAVAWLLRNTPAAFATSAETAAILAPLGVWLMIGDAWAILPLVATGSVLHFAGRRWNLEGVGVIAHGLFVGVAGLILVAAAERAERAGPGGAFDLLALSQGAGIALMFAITFAPLGESARPPYRVVAHLALMIWLLGELAPLEHGVGLISIAWGAYGTALLLASLRLKAKSVQFAGLSTLGIVAVKMILVDMAQLETIWRILLFMGFGAAFLWLSYMINRPTDAGPKAAP